MLLSEHPRFEELRAIAEKNAPGYVPQRHLPGGAGQSAQVILHALQKWKKAAPYCEKYLGFDLTAWPQYEAAWTFLARARFPLAPSVGCFTRRRYHPAKGQTPLQWP